MMSMILSAFSSAVKGAKEESDSSEISAFPYLAAAQIVNTSVLLFATIVR